VTGDTLGVGCESRDRTRSKVISCCLKTKFHYADFSVTSAISARQTRDVPDDFSAPRRRLPRFPAANGLVAREFFKPYRHVAMVNLKPRNFPVTGKFPGSRRNGNWA